MIKRQFRLFSIGVFLILVAILFDVYSGKQLSLDKYAKAITSSLHQQEEELDHFFTDKDFIKRQILAVEDHLQKEKDIIRLQELELKDYTLCIYKQDSLLFWTNNLILPSSNDLQSASPERNTTFKKLINGYYEVQKQSYKDAELGSYTIFGFIPIKYEFDLTSEHLENKFITTKEIPQSIGISMNETETSLVSKSGKHLCYLSTISPIKDKTQLRNSFLLYLLGFIFIAFSINSFSLQIGQPDKKWKGAMFLMLSVFGLRLISILFDFTGKFSDLHLFEKNFATSISNSLGDLLINIVLLLWIMVFYHRQFPIRDMNHFSKSLRFGIVTLFYFSILMAVVVLTGIFEGLVINTSIVFNFDNVLTFNKYSFIAIIGVILSLVATFLFSHRMVLSISKSGLSRHQRLAALGLAALIVFILLSFINLMVSSFYLMLIALIFGLMFDLFVDHNSTNFAWLVIWLFVLAAFPSILLFKYNAYKDRLVRISHAKELSDLKDPLAEKAFEEFKQRVVDYELEHGPLSKPYPFQSNARKIKKEINRIFTKSDYLFYNYSFDLYAFHKEYKEAAIEGQTIKYDDLIDKLNSSSNTSTQDLKFWNNNINKYNYLTSFDLPARNENPVNLFFEFKRKRREQSKVYTELIVDRPFKNLRNLSAYDYAIYNNNKYIDGEGGNYDKILNIEEVPKKGKYLELVTDKRSDVIYQGENGNIVFMGKEKETYIKAISLFSYIFSLLVGFVILFSILNTILNIFPGSLSFPIAKRRTLKYKIQVWVISLVIVSFVVIGGVSIWFFSYTSEEYHEKRLSRKTTSVLNDAMHEMEFKADKDSVDLLSNLVKPLSIIHRMDINLYNPKGELLESSEENIFDKGLVSRRMGFVAYQHLSKKQSSKYTQVERIGHLNYKSAYVPLKVKRNGQEKTVGYLGLPYYSKQSKLRSDVTVFMSTLLNAYVFLLLIAGGIAILTANSITRPLAVLGEKLKQFKLGKKNEPLEWDAQDELGDLINEYNKMIKKLGESADQLAQNAQEGAWREMAKQVAHEIKNPLTPMKLSIQYLQHAYKASPDNIEPLLKRVSNTLIEQIDNLANIASGFSNFAKMPRAENKKMVLNQLILSVFDLFSKEREDVKLTIDLPPRDLYVYADRNHLISVLNNIIKNAIQAIPDDRSGEVDIELYYKNDFAIVKISDNGTGIPSDKEDKVFVPNFTTKSSGTGLGLAISKNIIESIKGDIHFTTEVGVGTDFYIELPIVDVKELNEV